MTMSVLASRDVKRTVRGSAKWSQTALLDRACGKNFHEMVNDVIMNNYGFNFNVRELVEVCSVHGDVFVHPGVGEGKRGVVGALSDDQHPRILRLVDEFREHCGTDFKAWIYPCYMAKFSKSRLNKNQHIFSKSKTVSNLHFKFSLTGNSPKLFRYYVSKHV